MVKFIKGIFLNKPREGAPDFVKGSISMKVEDFLNNYQDWVNDKGYINIDVLQNQQGEFYLSPNDYGTKMANQNNEVNTRPESDPLQNVIDNFGGTPEMTAEDIIEAQQGDDDLSKIPF